MTPHQRQPEADVLHDRPGVRAFVAEARVGRLATVNAHGEPTVVPICFALLDGPQPLIVSVLDEKPKRVADADLARIRNIERHPAVCLVIDHYAEDWQQLRFAQVHGRARVMTIADERHAAAITVLRGKYPQYRSMAIDQRPVIAIDISSVNAWRGDGQRFT